MLSMKTIKITNQILKVVKKVISVALEYEKLTGRKLGITGEVGEVLVCDNRKLKLLNDPLEAGYDAIDNESKHYQIKARRSNNTNPGARIGRFAKHKFDYAILAFLEFDYSIKELWRATYKDLLPVIKRHERRNPSVNEFLRVAEKIFPSKKTEQKK